MSRKSRAKPPSPFRRFNSSPEIIRLVVLMYVRFPLCLRNVDDLLFERGIDVYHETVRSGGTGSGPCSQGDIRRRGVSAMRGFRYWQWHLDEMYVKINGELRYLWRAVDHEGEILESYITKTFCCELGFKAADRCMQIHGGMGLTTDLPIHKMWKDSRSFIITEGAVEIMRMALSREVLKMYK